MTPEFRARLENLMTDWYAGYRKGELDLAGLSAAMREIAIEQGEGAPFTSGIFGGATAGMIGGMLSAASMLRPVDEEKPAP